MKINHKLLDFHSRSGTLQVNYFNDDIPDGVVFSINLPLVDGQYPQGDALLSLINGYAPTDIFERAAQIRVQAPEVPVEALQVARHMEAPPEMILGDQQLFVYEGGERVLFVRPLVQLNGLGIPVEVI